MKRAHGSLSSRKGAKWSRDWATASKRALPSETGAGVFGAVVPPSAEALQRAIEAQVCPWCGEGPFRLLAVHTNKAHGVDRYELRQMAGLSRSAPVCSPEVSENRRANLLSRPQEIQEKWAAAGRAVRSEAQAKAVAASVAAGAQKKAAESSAKKAAAERSAMAGQLVEMFAAGKTLREISSEVGRSVPWVSVVLRSQGCDVAARAVTLRNAQAEKAHADHRGKILARFDELGGDWEASHRLADEVGCSHKHLVQLLRDAGVDLPDGRKVSSRRFWTRTKASGKPCSVSDCSGAAIKRGMCSKHYQRWRKHGDPLHVVTPERAPCSECGEPAQARSLCPKHYQRWLRREGRIS